MGSTAEWTVDENAGAGASQTGLLSILRSKPMVLRDALDGIASRWSGLSPFKVGKRE